jgi:hypothetical protein
VLQELCLSQTSLDTQDNGKPVLVAAADVPVAVEKLAVAAAVMVMIYYDSGSSPCTHMQLPEHLVQLHYYHPQQ